MREASLPASNGMIKLVVFDWNGVLIADAGICAKSVSSVLKSLGRKPIDIQTFRKVFSIPASNIYRSQGFTEDEIKKYANIIQERFHEDYEPRAARVRTRRGARKLLDYLYKHKIECIILSGHSTDGVQSQLKRLALEKYFSNVFANDIYGAMRGRNKFERLNQFLAERSLKKNDALIIGDSTEETEAGKRLGIHTVAITGGYVSTLRLKETHPDYLIGNLNQLIGIIEKLR